MQYSVVPFYPSVQKTAEYICREIRNNVSSPAAKQIMALLSFYKYIRPKKPLNVGDARDALVWSSVSFVAGRLEAYKKWKDLVADNKVWDHKRPIIDMQRGEWACDRSKYLKFNYDIWSNIHYGFVGRYVGFTAIELTSGGGYAQVKDNKMTIKEWAAQYSSNFFDGGLLGAFDDPYDTHAIQVGYKLYNQFKDNLADLTAEAIMTALYSVYQHNQSLNIEGCDMQCEGCRKLYICNPSK